MVEVIRRLVIWRWQLRTWLVVLIVVGIVAGLIFDALFGQFVSLRPERI